MFSVVIPAYNVEKVISRAIDSVLSQTVSCFEILVVDDGSKDNTKQVVDKYDDSRVRYIYQENQGVSAARNTGIRASSGEFVCFLDADDVWYKDHLETLSDLILKFPDCGLYITGYAICDTSGKIYPKTEKMLESYETSDFCTRNGFDLLQKYGYFIHTNSMCCRKSEFKKIGMFVPGVKNGEDDDLWYRFFAYCTIAVNRHTTTEYRRDESVATSKRYFVTDWPFEKRVPAILADPTLPEAVKNSLRRRMESRKLSYVRYLLVTGNKKEARLQFSQLNSDFLSSKKYWITKVCLLIPGKLIEAVINYRDRNFYSGSGTN